jgi:hypothetical protein
MTDARWYLIGALVPLAPWALWLWYRGALGAAFDNSFRVGQTLLAGWGKPTPPLHEPIRAFLSDPGILFRPEGVHQRWWFPPFLYLSTILFARRNGDSPHADVRLLAWVGLFYFTVALGRSDYEHWVKGTPVLWPLVLGIVERLRVAQRASTLVAPHPRATTLGRMVLSVLLLHYAWGPTRVHPRPAAWRPPRSTAPDTPGLGRIDLPKDMAETLAENRDTLARFAPPGRDAYIFSDESLYYFLGGVTNPTRTANASYIVGRKMAERAAMELRRRPPLCIMVPRRRRHRPDHQPILDVLAERYAKAHVNDSYEFWRPSRK